MTHEIVRWPDVAAYDVRISLAEVAADGPFSPFPGYRRWSFLAGEAPIVLVTRGGEGEGQEARERAGAVHRLVGLGDHVALDGALAIACELPGGPTRLLNVLVSERIAAQVGCGACAQPVRFVFALAAMAWLPAGHAAWFEPPARAALERQAVWLA